jgi:hypothetical protein
MEEFLDGLVPVWSVTMPQAAMKDILEKGRDSVFWSPAHKKKANAALLATADADEAVRLHAEMTAAAEKLAAAEERWLVLQDELAAFGDA